ncbi:polysaccharide lyase family 1 protein [Botryobasidium botryosum FD-172 SS1]|uniref:Polysaccharide lyase family 1 protein n=1 Tax=Botryobasidium botryosum (strain FD-172 SS1) TaxID=930990 RepID=A0A067MPZ4_BOTB1|nr:polysaccharide lyase family 1 protein [Botryobasidium botryosum FD-172 SS1]
MYVLALLEILCLRTTGGNGGATTTVTSLAALTSAAAGDTPGITLAFGTITGNTVAKVRSNKSILGKNGAECHHSHLKISKVLAMQLVSKRPLRPGLSYTFTFFANHVELSSDRDHDKDHYDGLLVITHGCTGATVSYSILRNHWKGSLVGHSDSNASEDVNTRVTYHRKYWCIASAEVRVLRTLCAHLTAGRSRARGSLRALWRTATPTLRLSVTSSRNVNHA